MVSGQHKTPCSGNRNRTFLAVSSFPSSTADMSRSARSMASLTPGMVFARIGAARKAARRTRLSFITKIGLDGLDISWCSVFECIDQDGVDGGR